MQAAYNLAVGYEMQDSIAAALDWALKAQAEARIVDGVDKKRFDSPWQSGYPLLRPYNTLRHRIKGTERRLIAPKYANAAI